MLTGRVHVNTGRVPSLWDYTGQQIKHKYNLGIGFVLLIFFIVFISLT